MTLYIEDMVSERCKVILNEALNRVNVSDARISLGQADFKGDLNEQQLDQLKSDLQNAGLVLVNNPRSILISRIKNVIIEMINGEKKSPTQTYSDYISERIHHNYTYLANIFSEAKGTTIQDFIISYKIEKAKELLRYNQLSISQISYKLNYSSVAHLSNQFKKLTGLSPSSYRKQKAKRSN